MRFLNYYLFQLQNIKSNESKSKQTALYFKLYFIITAANNAFLRTVTIDHDQYGDW